MHLADAISQWIKNQVEATGKNGVVVGLSGGIDSALVASLAVKGLGEKRVIALMLPAESDPGSLADAQLVAKKLGIKSHICDLTEIARNLREILPQTKKEVSSNIKPRLRMTALYHYAALNNCLVIGTGNKSELHIGYFTKYGDGGVDLQPLGDLYKHEVVNLARQLGVPTPIIDKPPSAGLFSGQTDEGEIGLTYNDIDYILECLGKQQRPECSTAKVARVKQLTQSARHKQRMAPFFSQNEISQEEMVYKDLKIIPGRYLVMQNEAPVEMTLKEYELLKFFMTHPEKVFTREQLLAEVWGVDFFGGIRTVDVHVRRLRAKLETEGKTYIETIRQVGYALKR